MLSTLAAVVEGRSPWPLYLYGGVGVGKTCAALALADYVPETLYETEASHGELCTQAASGRLEWYREGVGGVLTQNQLWRGYRRAPLVILDEIGSREKVSDFRYECLYRLVDERDGLPTILIGNCSLADLAAVYDERITSRIGVGTVVFADLPDQRDPRRRTKP